MNARSRSNSTSAISNTASPTWMAGSDMGLFHRGGRRLRLVGRRRFPAGRRGVARARILGLFSVGSGRIHRRPQVAQVEDPLEVEDEREALGGPRQPDEEA